MGVAPDPNAVPVSQPDPDIGAFLSKCRPGDVARDFGDAVERSPDSQLEAVAKSNIYPILGAMLPIL